MRLADLMAPDPVDAELASLDITGMTLDSRKIETGYLFAALPGVQVHGRDFAAQAVARGAVAVLSDGPIEGLGVPVIVVTDAAAELARIAARYYPGQPAHVVAVTGTNGKSSTVEFLRQIWSAAGIDGASLGTLGVARGGTIETTGYTTPDAVALHIALDRLAASGVTHLGMEASSHGLKQRRMDGVRLEIGGFTNLTQDHLDYHPDFTDYIACKERLFTERLPVDGRAVINVDSKSGVAMAETARKRGLGVTTLGWRGEDLQIVEITPRSASQDVVFSWNDHEYRVEIPLVGEFQILNALLAAALALVGGIKFETVLSTLGCLTGVPGRLEKVGETGAQAPILVDYAHTPDGIDKLLRAARPHTRGRIIIVFGCGGDRDTSKREIMGSIAAKQADQIIITDDNPRSEDPASIRAAILKGCPQAREIADRAEAIRVGVGMLGDGDCLLVAGKGHETGQSMGGTVYPFDDRVESRAALAELEAVNG
jgi:UDP-N-acetylmuramoyl-L-alanyl-D-glutamate--2,6-diaminopimelate ligase